MPVEECSAKELVSLTKAQGTCEMVAYTEKNMYAEDDTMTINLHVHNGTSSSSLPSLHLRLVITKRYKASSVIEKLAESPLASGLSKQSLFPSRMSVVVVLYSLAVWASDLSVLISWIS